MAGQAGFAPSDSRLVGGMRKELQSAALPSTAAARQATLRGRCGAFNSPPLPAVLPPAPPPPTTAGAYCPRPPRWPGRMSPSAPRSSRCSSSWRCRASRGARGVVGGDALCEWVAVAGGGRWAVDCTCSACWALHPHISPLRFCCAATCPTALLCLIPGLAGGTPSCWRR